MTDPPDFIISLRNDISPSPCSPPGLETPIFPFSLYLADRALLLRVRPSSISAFLIQNNKKGYNSPTLSASGQAWDVVRINGPPHPDPFSASTPSLSSAPPSLLPTSVFLKKLSKGPTAYLSASSSANHFFSDRLCHWIPALPRFFRNTRRSTRHFRHFVFGVFFVAIR